MRRPEGSEHDGDNARVRGCHCGGIPSPNCAAVIVALPSRPEVDLSWPPPRCLDGTDNITCAPNKSIHWAEVVILSRERPMEVRNFDRLRGMAEQTGASGMTLKFVPIDMDGIRPAPQAGTLRLVHGALPDGATLLERLKERLPRTIYAPEAERHWLPTARYAGAAR